MKKLVLGVILASGLLLSKEVNLEGYIASFDSKERTNMKIQSIEMLNMIEDGSAVLIDVRSKKEFASWSMGFAKNIPLEELPKRLRELPKDKLIITACPHNDRANIARIYLVTKEYNAKYLSDGLLKTADYLKGDNAEEFQDELQKGEKNENKF